MNDTLIEIKNHLQGSNSRVDEANNQINALEHKEGKNNHAEQQERKRIQKNEDSINSKGKLQELQHSHHRGSRRRTERTRNWKSI